MSNRGSGWAYPSLRTLGTDEMLAVFDEMIALLPEDFLQRRELALNSIRSWIEYRRNMLICG